MSADNGQATADNVVTSFDQQRLGRLRFARQAGFQYDGARDIYRVAGYVPEDGLEFSHYYSRYKRDAIAGRIVDMPAMTTWRSPPTLAEPEMDPDNPTRFAEEFAAFADRLQLWHRFERTDRLTGIGRYGVILIGDGDEMFASEMGRMSSPDDVLYLSCFHEGHATVEQWDADPTSERFGLPTEYMIDLSSGITGFPNAQAKVHWSRVVHVIEDPLSDEVFGRPRLQRLMNTIHDMEKVSAATGEAYWQIADRILQLSVDADATIGDEALEDLSGAVEEMYHDLRRFIAMQGAELSWLSGDPPNPEGALNLYMTLFSVGSGIPKRILFGSETGERASTEDQKTWLGQIGERAERFAEPVMIRALVDRLINYGAFTVPADGYEVLWPNRFEAPDKDVAETSRIRAEAAKALTPVGGDPGDRVVIEDGEVTLVDSAELDLEEPEPEEPEVVEPEDLGLPN